MPAHVSITTLSGPVTVAYRRFGRKVYATALQFDLVGIGKDKKTALTELRELFSDYLEEVLREPGPVRFFNPADVDNWNCPDKEHYRIAIVLTRTKDLPPITVRTIQELQPYRGRIQSVHLQPYALV